MTAPQSGQQPGLVASFGGWLGQVAWTWPLTSALVVLAGLAYADLARHAVLFEARYAIPLDVGVAAILVWWVLGRWLDLAPWHWERRWADSHRFSRAWPTYAAECGWAVSRTMPDGQTRMQVPRLDTYRRDPDRTTLTVSVTPGLTPDHFVEGGEALRHRLRARAVDVVTPGPGQVSITLWWVDRMGGPPPDARPADDPTWGVL